MEFVYSYVDTSKITGKTYLPIFINEQASRVYGDNLKKLKIEDILQNKNSGFENNNIFTEIVKDLYVEFDIYDNYIKLFDKDFTSPLSRTGIDVYNYVLHDTLDVKGRKIYHIKYYPRRVGGLTFKGEFFVDENTWAVTKINLESNKGADLNWIKEFYIEQEFQVFSDDLILLVKDFIMTDFSLNKKEKSKGMYGKRTTYFSNFIFDEEKPKEFYVAKVDNQNKDTKSNSEESWNALRVEKLDKVEENIYEMFDKLQDNKKFKKLVKLTGTLSSGYYLVNKFDFGSIFSFLGYNDIEGVRTRIGGRTYFSQDDKWRLEGYLAYGWKDEKFKYALRAKQMLYGDLRLIGFIGYKNDVEQISGRLIQSSDLLGRDFASSSILPVSGDLSKLTSIQHFSTGIELEPIRNVKIFTAYNYKQLKPADATKFPTTFIQNGIVQDFIKQHEWNIMLDITPNRKAIGFGVEQVSIRQRFPRILLNYTKGLDGLTEADFNYHKLQLYYRHPIILGGFGHSLVVVETGKTFGNVPLSLLNILPGNQMYFSLENAFNQLDYYEFITDQYFTLHYSHNFHGKIFSRIPLIRNLKLREIVGFKTAWGSISNENISLNRSIINYQAPTDKLYYEYFVGIGNIFKILRIDVSWRGNYLENSNARKFGIKVALEVNF